MKKEEDKMYNILLKIDNSLQAQNSTKRTFVQGIVRGLGTALGATVVFATVTWVTIEVANSIGIELLSGFFSNDIPR